ncbi:MAG: M20/M25/M40 family metallo-hydrolase, partial [bacterium]|nr:M20/M25/M40 family metallo-hydrolase [bacterium]
IPPRLEGVTYGADMRLLVNEGKTPTVLFGPGDVRQAHRPDEFVPVDHLVTAVRTLVLAALRFCGSNGRRSTTSRSV